MEQAFLDSIGYILATPLLDTFQLYHYLLHIIGTQTYFYQLYSMQLLWLSCAQHTSLWGYKIASGINKDTFEVQNLFCKIFIIIEYTLFNENCSIRNQGLTLNLKFWRNFSIGAFTSRTFFSLSHLEKFIWRDTSGINIIYYYDAMVIKLCNLC